MAGLIGKSRWAHSMGLGTAVCWGRKAGRQHGTRHHKLLSGEREGRTRMSFFKMPQHGANPAPADITSTRPQYWSESTYIYLHVVKHKQMSCRSPSSPEWQKCAALNLPAEFHVAPRKQPLHSIEFKASKFSLKIQPPHPPRARFQSQRHDWTILLCWQEITMLQHILPAYRITARTWFVVKDITVYAQTVMKNIKKVFISSSGSMIYHLCIMQSSHTHASKREIFTNNLHF